MDTALGVIALLTWHAPSGAALTDTGIEIVWVETVLVTPSDAGLHGCSMPVSGILTLPVSWLTKDAAAIVIGSAEEAPRLRERLIEGLLADGAAVLEIDVRGCSLRDADGVPATSGIRPETPVAALFDALLALMRDYGAGLVVAIGLGQEGSIILDAAGTPPRLEAAGRTFEALIQLRPDGAKFLPGGTPDAEENWPSRAEALCTVLATAAAVPPDIGRGAMQELRRSCVSSLLPSRPAGSSTVAAGFPY